MTEFSRSIAVCMLAAFAAGNGLAQVPSGTLPAPQSSTMQPQAGVVNGSAGDQSAIQAQRRSGMAKRRRAAAIEAANLQADQLMTANQDARPNVARTAHRSPTRHRSTSASGRAAPAHAARTADPSSADPGNSDATSKDAPP